MYVHRVILSILVISLIGVCSVLSQDDKGFIPSSNTINKDGNKWGVIIGINDYKDTNIIDLKYALNDAQALYSILTDSKYGGFNSNNVKLLTDNTPDKPTRENIIMALTGLENVADKDDTVFIAFSGHGIEEGGISYFIPYDANMSILRDTAIPMERFNETLNRTKAKIQVMFFDACHSGVRKDKSGSGKLSQNEFSRIFTEADGRVVLSSCDSEEVSYEYQEKSHGVFSYYLIEALKGDADRDNDRLVTVSETSNYVTAKVKQWAFNNGKRQNPRLKYNVSGEIVLTKTIPLPERSNIDTTPAITQLQGESTQPAINNQSSNANIPKEIIGKDGAKMVLIPAGEFQMGSNYGEDDEKPVHTVYTDAFYMDVYEVTNAQYKKFVQATGHREPASYKYINGSFQVASKLWQDSEQKDYNADNQPVVLITEDDAIAYCEWAGKRLPTEAEWEKAACGGLVGKKYSWGDTLTHDDANCAGTGGKDRWKYASPVGSFAPNGYGLYDMTGNVIELCADWYDAGYYAVSPKSNPKGPIHEQGDRRVYRGGSWNHSQNYIPYYPSIATRTTWFIGYLYSGDAGYDKDFRCVMDIPK